MTRVFIIEDEPVMAECVALAVESIEISTSEGEPVHPRVEIFSDAVTAMEGLHEQLPDLILLDVMLTGPDGFTFLNEMISYNDTAKIPVILITTLDLSGRDLGHYGVRHVLNKATMTPDDIRNAVHDCLAGGEEAASVMTEVTQTTPEPAPMVPGQTSLSELNRRFAELEASAAENQQNRKQPPYAH